MANTYTALHYHVVFSTKNRARHISQQIEAALPQSNRQGPIVTVGVIMQFIEKNSADVRSAVYRLAKPDSGLQFLLLPMIHVGTRKYYQDVRYRLSNCDLILAEGVTSKKARLLAYSYTVVRKIKRFDLVTQREALPLAGLPAKIINADMNAPAFDRRWSSLPFALRGFISIGVPIYIAHLLVYGTRETLAEGIALDDLPSRDEILNNDEFFNKLDDLIVNDRDKVLLGHITRLDRDASGMKQLVGVLFGAQHMRSVSALLRHRLGYRIIESDWMIVFDL